MQTFKSSYGRKGIRVSDPCPTRSLRYFLAGTHVATPLAEVEAEIRAAIARRCEGGDGGQWTEKAVRDTLRFTRWQHEENRAEYRYVNGGKS